MMLGLSLAQFTALHVAISLVAIAAGLIALPAYAAGRRLSLWLQVFLWTTLATSLTGFLFPIGGFTPALGVGIISVIDLAIAFAAWRKLASGGGAALVFGVTATLALYLNLFVLVVQSFLKVPTLNALAPTGTEPPFLAAQAVGLLASAVLGFVLARSLRRAAIA
ncbi:hypothetical protein [Novosphingobium album (ex Liu et al. 2023)]|uniref:DUF4175 domain-containing protein n=1 Tax=Novosphingobium album (ex Liu et al. 2023) TaxID=3031130 RepID=A0ABT5WV17_9SPHN|nr:hypothetical protein [Novosphingobium album (ex Liu et al. 2023)]MDE8653750.1 hypothetical protein [Novosphingobium album (ex Liu et al. 2023)]